MQTLWHQARKLSTREVANSGEFQTRANGKHRVKGGISVQEVKQTTYSQSEGRDFFSHLGILYYGQKTLKVWTLFQESTSPSILSGIHPHPRHRQCFSSTEMSPDVKLSQAAEAQAPGPTFSPESLSQDPDGRGGIGHQRQEQE